MKLSTATAAEEASIETLEARIRRVETQLILLTIAAIGAADFAVGREHSLGPLYLIPLSYSALTHRMGVTLVLLALCLVLRQWLGPLEESGRPWFYLGRDLLIAALFAVTVGFLNRLGTQRARFFALARRQRDELEKEVKTAADVQRRLLALSQPRLRGLDVVARTRPLKGVGGDYYDFIDMDGGRTCVVVADVAGKGLPAALFMPAIRIALHSITARRQEPAAIVEELNGILCQTTELASYATLILVIVEPTTGRLSWVNAGHPPGLLLSPGGGVSRLEAGGTPVGLIEAAGYESGETVLPPGGVLLLYSDGITEAEDESGRELGSESLASLVERVAGEPVETIADAIDVELERWLGAGKRTDDATLIVVKRPPGPNA